MTALVAGCLVLAAVAVLWPPPGARGRYRQLLGRPRRFPAPALPSWMRASRVAMLAGLAGVPVLAGLLGGPVAAVVVGAYTAVAGRALARRNQQRERSVRRATLLEAIGSAAADLRAGLAAGTALASLTTAAGLTTAADPATHTRPATPTDLASPAGSVASGAQAPVKPASAGVDGLADQVQAVIRLADRTGAPLADLLEQLEADARSSDRAQAAAAAQAAGSRATAWLLAMLPAGGIGLGYAIGADPLTVLLRSPVGAASALGAVILQVAGMAWTSRISRPTAAVV